VSGVPGRAALCHATPGLQAEAERAQLRRELTAPRRSKGFGDLDQQPVEIKLLAVVLGGGLLWGMMELVQWISARMEGGAPV